ncbi:MAG: hypothetical protein CME64_00320 [Halobacteriovoraceae bacterium]|nr:hypothetical protein [Halobacteriovoraceae bacterium]|tara:strand:- start:81951 stop:82616 length:666 start_codon:yes stop_codon:yes gene_type:complete
MNEDHYSFRLISLRNADLGESEVVDRAFKFWKTMWRDFFVQKDLEFPDWDDEFYRHDYLALLSYKERPVGFHLYGLQNLNIEACRGSKYMSSNFDEKFKETLIQQGTPKAMSINWLTIDVLFSKNNRKYSVIDLMGGLAMNSCDHLNYDLMIAAIRNDIPLAKKTLACGGVKLGEKLVYETPCDLVYLPKVRSVFPQETQNLIKQLWDKDQTNRETIKKAA